MLTERAIVLLGNETTVWCHWGSDSAISDQINCFCNSGHSLFSLFCRAGVEVLFNELETPVEEYSFGRSKIFIRNPRTVSLRNPSTLNGRPSHVDGSSKSAALGDMTRGAATNIPFSFCLRCPRGWASEGSWQSLCVPHEASTSLIRYVVRERIIKNLFMKQQNLTSS